MWQWLPLTLEVLLAIIGIFLVVLGLLLVTFFLLKRFALRRYQTPYDTINNRIRDLRSIDESNEKHYDFFVSYKSEDAMAVRYIVEKMLANGVNVWFAEYCILLSGRESFEQAIATGIAHTKYGLCFTNNRYITSKYCLDELEQLLDSRNCGAQRVIEIQFPYEPLPHQYCPQLTITPRISYENDLDALMCQVGTITGLSVSLTPAPQLLAPTYWVFYYDNQSYRLDLAGWSLSSTGSSKLANGEVDGPVCERMCGGQYMIRGHLNIGRQIAFPRANYKADDRENYEYGIGFAKFHFATLPAQCVGVHLFYLHGLSHIALTSRSINGWCRTYSVIIPIPNTERYVEFLFDFYIRSPFSEFCRYTHYMESLVQSLTWV